MVQLTGNLSSHSLEGELKEMKNTPWATVCLSNRVIKIDRYCFSLHTSFFWKIGNDNLKLIREQSMVGALYILQ